MLGRLVFNTGPIRIVPMVVIQKREKDMVGFVKHRRATLVRHPLWVACLLAGAVASAGLHAQDAATAPQADAGSTKTKAPSKDDATSLGAITVTATKHATAIDKTPIAISAVPADPTRTGYVFDGWFVGGDVYDFDAPVTGDVVLVAHWTRVTHTVSFDTAGGSAAPEDQTVGEGDTASVPDAPTRTGYTFDGWYAGDEVYDYLVSVNTGHPGSITSVHADSAEMAFVALAQLMKRSQAGQGMSTREGVELAQMSVDVVVQCARDRNSPGTPRIVREIWYDPRSKHRGLS